VSGVSRQLSFDGLEGAQLPIRHVPSAAPGRALTDEQEQAVARRSEPLQLSAAAGSGKTSVLVERFVRAVREDGMAPGKILAITFTDRAAGELRERVRARLLELGEREAARDADAAFVGTFHGFCARLLRAHALMVGIDPDFAILDEGVAGRLRGQAFRAALREFVRGERVEAVELVAAYGADRVERMIVGVHAQLRSRGQRLPTLPGPRLVPAPVPVPTPMSAFMPVASSTSSAPQSSASTEPSEALDADAAAACVLLDELLRRFVGAYERLKHGRGAVDFDDLELFAAELLDEREGVRAAWSTRFELLMVDEFQDTNPRQIGILRALERGNLFTVGDEHQSIYGFRHADVSQFRARREELDVCGGSLALTRNFRSRPPLLDVVNAVFAERFEAFAPLVAGREDTGEAEEGTGAGEAKKGTGPGEAGGAAQAQGAVARERLTKQRARGSEPLVELLLSARSGWDGTAGLGERIGVGLPFAPLWRQAEARMLAQRVEELVQGGRAQAGEVVVLLRALGDVEVYERALQMRGLQTLAAVGAFWERQQVADLLSYLRALANPLDEQALYATLASPLVGLSRDGLALLAGAAREGARGVWETVSGQAAEEALSVLAAPDADALSAFCARLQSERGAASRRTISALIERAVEGGSYREHALALGWGERRLANVHKLLRLARRFEASEGRDLRAFLDHVVYLKDVAASGESDAPVDGVEPDAVRLMSIHAAKGLEFAVVCVADLGRAPSTRMPDLLVDGERIGLQLVRLDGAKATPSLDFKTLCEERRRAEAEEEDRIVYVAMTRARERLVLSGAVEFDRWPEQRPGATAISWLGPALAPELPQLVQTALEPVHDLALGRAATAGVLGAATVRCWLNTPANVGTVLRLDEGAPRITGRTPPYVNRAHEGETIAHGGDDDGQRHQRPGPVEPAGDQPMVGLQASGVGIEPAGDQPTVGLQASGVAAVPRIATFSYSALSELERCGYRYYLERVLGLPEDRAAARRSRSGDGLEARMRGTLVHRLLEDLDFARPATVAPAHVRRVARELGMRLGEGEGEKIAALIDRASSSTLAVRLAAAEQVRREHPFAFSLDGEAPLISGVIDLLAREPDGGVLVLDYKSDRVAPDADLGALVERDYAVQRLLYALAVLRDGAASVEVVHWFLERPEEGVGARYTAADRGELEQSLTARLRRARSDPFDVSPNPHRGLCLTCPGRAGLCSWSEQATLREDARI